MKSKIVYVELGTGGNHDGPAWIGRALFSKTGKTVYFNGMAFHGGKGWTSEVKTGHPYWVSGVKKNGQDRHWANNRPSRHKIKIDGDVVDEYLSIRGLPELPKNIFEIVALDNTPTKQEVNEIQNATLDELRQSEAWRSKIEYATRNTRYNESQSNDK